MKLKCNRLWRLAKRNCYNICEIDCRKQMMILHKSRFIRNAYCIIDWILTCVFDMWKDSNLFMQLRSGRWLRWFQKHLVWVSPPSQVEVWIQEEPWRRWARKGRSGWRSNTMFYAWKVNLCQNWFCLYKLFPSVLVKFGKNFQCILCTAWSPSSENWSVCCLSCLPLSKSPCKMRW